MKKYLELYYIESLWGLSVEEIKENFSNYNFVPSVTTHGTIEPNSLRFRDTIFDIDSLVVFYWYEWNNKLCLGTIAVNFVLAPKDNHQAVIELKTHYERIKKVLIEKYGQPMAIDHKISSSIMTQWIDKKNVIALMINEDPTFPEFQFLVLVYRSIEYDPLAHSIANRLSKNKNVEKNK